MSEQHRVNRPGHVDSGNRDLLTEGCKFLIVDEEATSRMSLSQVMKANGFLVKEACSLEEALHFLLQDHFGGVFLHFPISQSNDLCLMELVRQIAREELIVVPDDQPTAERAIASQKGWRRKLADWTEQRRRGSPGSIGRISPELRRGSIVPANCA